MIGGQPTNAMSMDGWDRHHRGNSIGSSYGAFLELKMMLGVNEGWAAIGAPACCRQSTRGNRMNVGCRYQLIPKSQGKRRPVMKEDKEADRKNKVVVVAVVETSEDQDFQAA